MDASFLFWCISWVQKQNPMKRKLTDKNLSCCKKWSTSPNSTWARKHWTSQKMFFWSLNVNSTVTSRNSFKLVIKMFFFCSNIIHHFASSSVWSFIYSYRVLSHTHFLSSTVWSHLHRLDGGKEVRVCVMRQNPQRRVKADLCVCVCVCVCVRLFYWLVPFGPPQRGGGCGGRCRGWLVDQKGWWVQQRINWESKTPTLGPVHAWQSHTYTHTEDSVKTMKLNEQLIINECCTFTAKSCRLTQAHTQAHTHTECKVHILL